LDLDDSDDADIDEFVEGCMCVRWNFASRRLVFVWIGTFLQLAVSGQWLPATHGR